MSSKAFKNRVDWLHRTATRFWSKVEFAGPEDCWIWTGTKLLPNACGQVYGSFGVTDVDRNISYRAHRFAYMLTHGEIPEGHVVMHTCDNPLCVNPAHLVAGTQYENMQDRNSKGRVSHGEAYPNSAITEAQAIEAYNSKESPSTLAKRWGVDSSVIYKIRKGVSWWRVTGATPPNGEKNDSA